MITAADRLVDACRAGDVDGAAVLLEAAAEPDGVGSSGMTPLVAAVESGCSELVKSLLEAGATASLASRNNTPLRAAVMATDFTCMELLLAAGADTNQEAPARGTPLMAAAGAPSCLINED